MRHRHLVIAGLVTIGFALCLGLPGSGPVYANPVFADERSLSYGAELYALYCSDCHGTEITDRPAAPVESGESADAIDYSELIDIAQANRAAAADKWPEWAERPAAPEVEVPDERMTALNEVKEIIEQAHRVKPMSKRPHYSNGSSSQTKGGGFETKPGATNLADPQSYYYGTTEDELFESIAKGTGAAMPGWRTKLGSDEAIWDVVNYIRSFWDEEWLY